MHLIELADIPFDKLAGIGITRQEAEEVRGLVGTINAAGQF